MAEKPDKKTEEAIDAPVVDDVTLAEAEVQTSDDAPADDAAALSATDEPEAAVAADDAEATEAEATEDEPAEADASAEAAETETPAAPSGPKGPARQEPVSIEERAERRVAERKRKAAQRTRFRARAKERRKAARVEAPVHEADHAPEHGPGRPKTRQGVVISAKPDKTISVRIDTARRHPRYHKIMRTSSTLHVHDERNDANEGDTVRVVETRPMSRTKRWRLVEVVERAR
jgi:small subunit ribosomal protein S17